jgi:amino acid transporter
VLLSIAILALLYLAMNLSIIGVLPWREAIGSHSIVSDFIQRLYGVTAASWMTGLILLIAFASVFCVLLGYTRVPFAAAAEGRFFAVFARVHPRRHFPSFSVVFMGLMASAACLFSLESLIKALLVIQIVTQFAAQCIAVVVIRKSRPDIHRPFHMPLFPIPALIALAGWIFILITSGAAYLLSGLALVLLGITAYLIRARRTHEWPWSPPSITR